MEYQRLICDWNAVTVSCDWTAARHELNPRAGT